MSPARRQDDDTKLQPQIRKSTTREPGLVSRSRCTRPNRRNKTKQGKDAFISLPIRVLKSESYRLVSPSAKALLVEFSYRYSGGNNGDLSMPFSSAKQWGYASERRLNRAVGELLEHDLIKRTRIGRGGYGGGMPHLYALTWLPICNIKGKPDITPGPEPRRTFTEAETYAGR